jgi:hypothetical protein
MITLPTLQDGDLLQATVNGAPGWLRALGCNNGTVKLAQFLPKGSRQQQDLTDPVIMAPTMFIRAAYSANSLFEALMRVLGIAAAVQATK